MYFRFAAGVAGAALGCFMAACSSPLDAPRDPSSRLSRPMPHNASAPPSSAFRASAGDRVAAADLSGTPAPDEYVRYALYHSPAVEAAYQTWVAATERLPQASGLPDPRLTMGFFLDEVETRTGPQQARFGVSQSFP